MSKKLIYLVFVVLVLGLAHSVRATTNIIIVTNNPGDEADYTPFLKSILGYDITVEAEDDKYIDPLNAAAKANLSAADLIIVSRRTSSGNFTAEIDFWNGLTTPMILHSSFLLGDDRWRWLPGGTENVDLTDVAVVDRNSPIFDGVTITDNQVKIFSSLVTGLDVSNQDSAGNSTKIATPAGSNRVMIAHWDAGTEYYPGSGQIAGGPRIFFGMRTDEFFPFVTEDGKKMLENAILILLGLFRGDPIALDPSPADVETDVPHDVVLAWTPGELANTHDVYFGTVFEDVNDASRANPLGVLVIQDQSADTYDPGRLEFDQTYYWRIDEVNAPPDFTVFKGDVWSFTVEPFAYPIAGENITATASSSEEGRGSENTINGSGLDANDLHSRESAAMWLSISGGPQPVWIQYEFDRVYKLYEMWVWNYNVEFEHVLGFGFKDVTVEYSENGTDWTALGSFEFAQGPGQDGYAHNTTVDFGIVAAKYVKLTANSNWGGLVPQYGLSEIRFFYIPVVAREPNPASGATDMDVDNVTLSWRAGREAASHNLYFSTDEQAVIDETISPVIIPADSSYVSYDTGELELGQSYYWKVNEVNEAETPTTWNFSTQEYLVVDDIEDYNDFEPDRVFDTWIDGWGDPTNGSQVGYAEPSFVEKTIVHGGKQSMPLSYDNSTASHSEATANVANLPVSQDWTKYGAQTLVLYFHGTGGNTGQLYVKLNDSKVVYDGDAADIAKLQWKQWNINLASLGVNLQNVTKLSIGIDGNGASGTLYLDDIRLYRLAPEPQAN